MHPGDIFPSSHQILNFFNEPFHFPTMPLPHLSCNPDAALAHRFGSVGTSQHHAGSLFSRICAWGIGRLPNGGCSVLPNVNGVKCDHSADKCKQVSFRLAVEIIPQFCNLGTIDFVDVDYSISRLSQWYSDAFRCSFRVMRVWCFLVSTLMIDTTDSVSVPPHLRIANEFARALAANTFLFHSGRLWELPFFLLFTKSRSSGVFAGDDTPSRTAS